MARLFEHSNCPNPVQWGSSPVKTVYIRDTDPGSGKLKWKPVGFICMGCGVFRADKGWFPSGKAEPVCRPWQPSRDEEPARDIDTETEEIQAIEEDLEGPAEASRDHTLEAHIDYGGPGKPFGSETGISAGATAEFNAIKVFQRPPARRPGRPVKRISPEMAAKVLQISPESVREKIRAGEIPAEKDPWRHWRIDAAWYRNKCRALGYAYPGEVADAEV